MIAMWEHSNALTSIPHSRQDTLFILASAPQILRASCWAAGTGTVDSSPVWTPETVTFIFSVLRFFASRSLLRCTCCSALIVNEGLSADSGGPTVRRTPIQHSAPRIWGALCPRPSALSPHLGESVMLCLVSPSLDPALRVSPGCKPRDPSAPSLFPTSQGSLPVAWCTVSWKTLFPEVSISGYFLYQRVHLGHECKYKVKFSDTS